MSKDTKKVVEKPIYNINIDRVENGYVVGYIQDSKAKRQVFLTWIDTVTWLYTQNDTVKEIPRAGVPSASGGVSNLVEEGPLLKDE